MNSLVTIPLPTAFILQKLDQASFDAYIVGGAVRDILLKKTIVDWDFTTNAKPEEIQLLFSQSFYENDFGTVGISYQHLVEQMELTDISWLDDFWLSLGEKQKSDRIINLAQATKIHLSLANKVEANGDQSPNLPPFEITTYRSDGLYQDFRRPTQVSWGKTIEEDLARRDFTINALALKIDNQALTKKIAEALAQEQPLLTFQPDEYTLIDLFDGLLDLEQAQLRTVGNPDDRFQEDALRMLRAIRFSVQLNMKIEPATFTSIKTHADLLQHISWERIRDEFLKILQSSYPAEGIELLDEVGMLSHILPELLEAKAVNQGGHHTTDVWTHSLDALRECPSTDPIVRLATLLHDIAKPRTVGDNNGNITFYNHEIVGAKMAKEIGRRLRLAKEQINRLYILVRYHMFYYQPHNTDAAIRRFMRKVGLDNVDDILDLREADRLGSGARRTSWRLEEMKQRMIDQLHQPFDTSDLAINGNDLMVAFELKPGPQLGEILQNLLEMVLENPELNTKENLLNEAKKLFTS